MSALLPQGSKRLQRSHDRWYSVRHRAPPLRAIQDFSACPLILSPTIPDGKSNIPSTFRSKHVIGLLSHAFTELIIVRLHASRMHSPANRPHVPRGCHTPNYPYENPRTYLPRPPIGRANKHLLFPATAFCFGGARALTVNNFPCGLHVCGCVAACSIFREAFRMSVSCPV